MQIDQVATQQEGPEAQESSFLFVRLVDWLSSLVGLVAIGCLLVMTAIICYEIISRYFFGTPTYWVTEISTYLFMALTFFAVAAAHKAGAHIRVELLIDLVPEWIAHHLRVNAAWVGLFTIAFVAWQMVIFNYWDYVYDTRDWGLLSTKQWIVQLPLSVGLTALSLSILSEAYKLQPVAAPWRRWLVPVIVATAVAGLWMIGPDTARINGTTLDWGSVIIAAAVAASILAWSGWKTLLMVTALLAILGVGFYLAKPFPFLYVVFFLAGAILLLLVLGVRIAFALAAVGLFGLYFLLPQPQLSLLAERSWNSINTFTLTAVPMFVFMGSILLRSGIAGAMFDALTRLFGRARGGLAYSSVGASTVFAAVSGSSLATAATMGTVACPEMVKRGYSARLTYGVVAAGATLGILIPPSIAMIIYGNTVGAPITVLFIAGIIPGLTLMLAFMAGAFIWSRVQPSATPAGQPVSWREKLFGLAGFLPFAVIIFAVLGSLYGGIATPTEAGAIGALFALILSGVQRKLSIRMIYDATFETVKITAFLMLIVVGAAILSWVFDYLNLPRFMVNAIEAANLDPWVVALSIAILYIILGMFIEPISMMLMTLPVTFPILTAMGFDPIWIGIALVMVIEVGLITPPVGIILFVLRGVSGDTALKEIVYGVMPFVVIILAFLVFIYLFPGYVAWLPERWG